jgi:hypothetical protein
MKRNRKRSAALAAPCRLGEGNPYLDAELVAGLDPVQPRPGGSRSECQLRSVKVVRGRRDPIFPSFHLPAPSKNHRRRKLRKG